MSIDPLEIILNSLNEVKTEVRADIKGIHDRLDALNGRTRKVERTTHTQWIILSIVGAVLLVVIPVVLGVFLG